MNPPKRILIAGIGNIFFGDDAFGCEVARRLCQSQWPDNVQVRDFGIRGIDLAYALMETFDQVILIDAVPRGGAPGTLYVIEPDAPDPTRKPQKRNRCGMPTRWTQSKCFAWRNRSARKSIMF